MIENNNESELIDHHRSCSIKKVRFLNDSTVVLELSDEREIKLGYGTWVELDLPKDEFLTQEQLELLEQKALYTLIRNKALDLLSVREHSSRELRQKLNQKFYKFKNKDSEDLIEQCLQEMQERDFQNDERFTRHFIESRLSNKLHGPFRILAELQNRGISREQCEILIDELQTQEQWIEKATLLLKKLNRSGKPKNKATLGQKLYQNGFSWSTITETLDSSNILEQSETDYS